MYYYQYPQKDSFENKVKQLQADKKELTQAIEQLNFCYQEKIALLQNTIAQQQDKYEQLLQWKQSYIDKSLFEVQRYQVQIKRMIEILDNAHKNFENEKSLLIKDMEGHEQVIKCLREENAALNQFNSQNQFKIGEIVRSYTEQIERLKQQLKELREESTFSEESSVVALREISSSQNMENFQPNSTRSITIKGEPALSKVSIHTSMQ